MLLRSALTTPTLFLALAEYQAGSSQTSMSDDASSDGSEERFSFLFRQEYLVSFGINLAFYGEFS
jgi:hypothetical protein